MLKPASTKDAFAVARGSLRIRVSVRRYRLQVPFSASVSGGKNPRSKLDVARKCGRRRGGPGDLLARLLWRLRHDRSGVNRLKFAWKILRLRQVGLSDERILENFRTFSVGRPVGYP